MAVARNGLMRREPSAPRVVIGVQPPLVIVDEHAVARQVGLRASELRGRRRAAAKRPAIQVQRLLARPGNFRFAPLAPRHGG